jgi:spore germination protein KB
MLFIFITGTFLIFLLLIIPLFHPEYLLPLFPEEIKPIIHGAYINYGFPYGEVIFFAVLLPFARSKKGKTLEKAMFFGIALSGLLLMIAVLVSIMILGPAGVEIKYSLFYIATLIDIQDVLTRIEAIIAMAWIIGSYMKATIALFAFNFTISQLLNLKDDRILIFPLAFLAFLVSVTTFKHELEFTEAVSVVYPVIITVAGVLPILLITVFTLFKKKQKNQNDYNA